MNLYMTSLLIYGGLFVVGTLISLLISYLKCQKVGFTTSLSEGAIWSSLPSLTFFFANWFPAVKGPFSRLFQSWFTMDAEKADMIGLGYLMMLGSWIMTTRMVHTTEVEVCKPSVDEMRVFQEQLMRELQEKQKAEEENEKKPTS